MEHGIRGGNLDRGSGELENAIVSLLRWVRYENKNDRHVDRYWVTFARNKWKIVGLIKVLGEKKAGYACGTRRNRVSII